MHARVLYVIAFGLLLATLFLQFTRLESGNIAVKGISFEAPKVTVTDATIRPVKELGADWISVMPYAFSRKDQATIIFNSPYQWKGERDEGVKETIAAARENGLRVMLKPHLWIPGKFTGDVRFDNEEQWKEWEQSYRKYMLHYARLAESEKVEMYCIGTELKAFVQDRPGFWDELIAEVRNVYSGKLTYAANWDNFEHIPFWEQLDCIGVDAYFPLSESKTPEVDELVEAWQPWLMKMEYQSERTGREVIFTEIGYRSTDYCAQKPWVSYEDMGNENQKAQCNALIACFKVIKASPFIKGGFLWKWHTDEHLPKEGNKDYAFQNKNALEVVKQYY